jgi:hypothetical protein
MSEKPRSLIEHFELQDVLHEALKKGVETYAKTAAQEAISDQVSILIRDMSADVVGVFCGNVAGSILKSMLGIQDKIAAKLDVMAAKLDKLVREPFETGTRVAREALYAQWHGEDERVFREQRLRYAIEKLDAAFTLSRDSKSSQQEQILIELIQGLCLLEIRGGLSLARARFASIIPTLEVQANEMWREERVLTGASEKLELDARFKGKSVPRSMRPYNEKWKLEARRMHRSAPDLFALVSILKGV